ncbi:hypothetical protein OROGR_002184 [Orobanche gracilis]
MASLTESATSETLKLQSYTEQELLCVYDKYKSSLDFFQQQPALDYTSFTGISTAEDLGDRTMFLAKAMPFHTEKLPDFPTRLLNFMQSSARILPLDLMVQLTEALVFLINSKMIDIAETLQALMGLQTLGDGLIQQLAFSYVIQSIIHMNQEHKNDLQNILFRMLQQEDEAKAERALITLCDLHRKKVWSDDRTADAICIACLNPSSSVMIVALSFLLEFEKMEDDDSGDSDSKDDQATPQPQILLNKEAMYKASHKGTTSSKKEVAELRHVARSMKLQQYLSSEKSNKNYCSPLKLLKDAQGFSEKLFSRLKLSSNERFEVQMKMTEVIARTVGLHHLILLDFYPYLRKYIKSHQRDITTVLAAAVHAFHEMVPCDAVEPLLQQIVNQLLHDRPCGQDIKVVFSLLRKIRGRVPSLTTDGNKSKGKKRVLFSTMNAVNMSSGALKELSIKHLKQLSGDERIKRTKLQPGRTPDAGQFVFVCKRSVCACCREKRKIESQDRKNLPREEDSKSSPREEESETFRQIVPWKESMEVIYSLGNLGSCFTHCPVL